MLNIDIQRRQGDTSFSYVISLCKPTPAQLNFEMSHFGWKLLRSRSPLGLELLTVFQFLPACKGTLAAEMCAVSCFFFF